MSDASDLMALGMAPALSNEIIEKIAKGNSGAKLTPQKTPVITVADPVDDEDLQANFDRLTAALKAAGVFT